MSRTDVLTEKAQELLFNDLLSRADNQQCADCDNKTPTWASIDFGIFICMRCAGVHRQLGPHITRVRSTKLDTWKKDNVEILAHVGNKIANDFYEAKMPSGFRKPTSNYTMAQVAKFVDEKYIKKLFAANSSQTPVKEFVSNRENGIIKAPTLTKEKSEPSSHHREKLQRKRSLSVEQKKEEPQVKQNQDIDLLSAADDLLTSQADTNLFEAFQEAEPQPKETKKVSFEGFKKQGSQTQQQGGDLLQASNQSTTNPIFQFNFNPNQNSQQVQQTTQQQTQQQNFQQQFFQQNQQQQQQTQQTQQQQTTKQPDLMSLYSQTSNTTTNNTKGYGSNNHNWNELNFLGNNTQQTQQMGNMGNFGYSGYNQQGNYGYGNNQNGFNNYGGYSNGSSNGFNYGNNTSTNNSNFGNGYGNGSYNGGYNNGGFNNGGYSNQGNLNNGFGNNNFGTQNMYSNNNFMKLN